MQRGEFKTTRDKHEGLTTELQGRSYDATFRILDDGGRPLLIGHRRNSVLVMLFPAGKLKKRLRFTAGFN